LNDESSILDEDFLRQQQFLEDYIEAELRESRRKSSSDSKVANQNESSLVSVKSIKGKQQPKRQEQDKVKEGFVKVTVSSGSNEVNHFSRSISHDPDFDLTNESDEDDDQSRYNDSDHDDSRREIEEDEIVPVDSSFQEISGIERSFEEVYPDEQPRKRSTDRSFPKHHVKIHPKESEQHHQHHHHQQQQQQQQSFRKNQPINLKIGVSHQNNNGHTHSKKSFEEVTYKIPMQDDQHREQAVHIVGHRHHHHDNNHSHGHTHQKKAFEEVTYKIPVHDEQSTHMIVNPSPRDSHIDFENCSVTDFEVEKNLSANSYQQTYQKSYHEHHHQPVDIEITREGNNKRAIRILVSPSQQTHQQPGFIPIHKVEATNDHQQPPMKTQIIKIKPTAVRSSNSPVDLVDGGSRRGKKMVIEDLVNVSYQQYQQEEPDLYYEKQRKTSNDSDIHQIKRIRKSSLPEGFDDSDFRRETDLQLQQQRNMQQRMSNRQHNESRDTRPTQQNSEYTKQQQYHQHKLMQHQQHLQRIQQQRKQQQQRVSTQQNDSHSHVVLNGKVMRRHSFDNSSYKERQHYDDVAQQQQRQVKTITRDRKQTRVRRLSYEQEREKLEEELKQLQEKAFKKHQQQERQQEINQQHHQQQQLQHYQRHQEQEKVRKQQQEQHFEEQELQRQERNRQQVQYQDRQNYQQQSITTTTTKNSLKMLSTNITTAQDLQKQNRFNNLQPQQRFVSQSASNTPNMSRHHHNFDQAQPASTNSTPNQGRKRGKIPNNMKVAFQSEDIINNETKMGRRRKSNPNLILGRTDINKQQLDSENDFSNHSHTLPRSFGRRNNNNKKQQILQSQTVRNLITLC